MSVWVCVLVCTTYMQGDGGYSAEFKVQGAGSGKLFNMYYLWTRVGASHCSQVILSLQKFGMYDYNGWLVFEYIQL